MAASALVYQSQSIHPKQNQKQIKHESNKSYMLQLEEKAIRSVKKNKNNFINVIRDKFTISVDEKN